MIVSPPGFTPGVTQTVTVGASSVSVSLASDAPLVRLLLEGGTAGTLAFIRIGTGAQTAAATDYPIAANVEVFLNKGVGANTLAAIANGLGVGATLYVTAGG